MKRLLLAAAWVFTAFIGFRIARRLASTLAPRLMEPMMEHGMPRMMDACFERMPLERRRFMLAHCRGMLDRVEAKYASGEPQPAAEGGRVA